MKDAAKLNYSFEFFDDSLSVFELTEKYFPFNRHVQDFNVRYAKDPHEVIIDAELDMINSQYRENSGPGYFGFHHKIANKDHKILVLRIDFLLWKDNAEGILRALKKIKGEDPDDVTPKDIETWFFESIARGVNDAILKRYLIDLKKGKKNPVKPLREVSEHRMFCCGIPVKDETAKIILYKLLQEMQVIDDEGECLATGNRGNTGSTRLFATVNYIICAQEQPFKRLLKNQNSTMKGIVEAFNKHSGTKLSYAKKGKLFDKYFNEAQGIFLRLKNN